MYFAVVIPYVISENFFFLISLIIMLSFLLVFTCEPSAAAASITALYLLTLKKEFEFRS